MPDSKRGDFFTVPAEDEVKQMRILLADVTDVASMRSVLGEPDRTVHWSEDKDLRNDYYPIERWKTQYTYLSKWTSLDLCVCEKEDGSVTSFWHGKEKQEQ